MSQPLRQLRTDGRLPFDRYVMSPAPLCQVEVDGELRWLPRPVLRIDIPLGLHRFRRDVLRYWREAGTPLAVGPDQALWSGVYWPRGGDAGGGICRDAWHTLHHLRAVLWRPHLQGLSPSWVLARIRPWSSLTHRHGADLQLDGVPIEEAPVIPLTDPDSDPDRWRSP